MKKFLFVPLLAVWTLLLCVSGAASAAGQSQIAVVVVGGSDYKTKDYFSSIKEYLAEPFDETNINVSYGDAVQTKYEEYWLDKGELDEPRPGKQDLIDFVSYGNYNKVLYIVIKDSVVDTNGRGKNNDYVRTSIGINAILANKDGIIKTQNINDESVSKTSVLRAKRTAFKKCMEEIGKTMVPLIKQNKR